MPVIRVLHAGSLTNFLRNMANRFEKFKPQIHIELVGQGSRQCAQDILKGDNADAFISADIHCIRDLLMPEKVKQAYIFASTELVLAYTKQSRYADQISTQNWYDILINKHVSYGHTDPNLDPAGYRTLFCWQLAEQFYKNIMDPRI